MKGNRTNGTSSDLSAYYWVNGWFIVSRINFS